MKDIGKAFSFPFKDQRWIGKFLLAAVFMILAIVGIGIFILAGYLIQVTQRVMRREEELLPDWSDIGIKFIIGFKFVVVYMVYILPVLLLLLPMMVLSILAEVSHQPEVLGVVTVVYLFGFILLIIPYSLALTALMPIISYRFAERERISDALDIAEIIRSFRRNWQSTVVVALVTVGLESFAPIGILFFIVGCFFTLFYAYLVSAYLHGALYLEKGTEVVAS